MKPKGRKSQGHTHPHNSNTSAPFNSFNLFTALVLPIKLPMAPSTASSSSSATDSPSLASKALNQAKYVVTGGALVYYFGVGKEFSDVLHTSGLPRYVFALESFCQLGATKGLSTWTDVSRPQRNRSSVISSDPRNNINIPLPPRLSTPLQAHQSRREWCSFAQPAAVRLAHG